MTVYEFMKVAPYGNIDFNISKIPWYFYVILYYLVFFYCYYFVTG